MNREKLKKKIIENTFITIGGWGLEAPQEDVTLDDQGRLVSIRTHNAEFRWLTRQPRPGHVLVPLEGADYGLTCEWLADLGKRQPTDPYARLFMEDPDEGVRAWLDDASEIFLEAGWYTEEDDDGEVTLFPVDPCLL